MKKLAVFPLIAALAVFVSCQKQPTEEERKAEVERQVQDRLAAERAAAEKDRLAKEQADLEAREKAVADREAAAAASPTPVVEESVTTPAQEVVTERIDSEAAAEPQSTAAYGMFYEKLEPQGEWLETSQYGYVFQPHEAEISRDWRPYTEGHWVYSDAGWTWVSDEPFGWATYHYGRWVRLRRVGWVWVPGKQRAPAWVSWRSSKDYVGWAPLPPEARFDRRSGIHNWADNYYDIGPDQYSFVPCNEFGAEHVRRAVVPPERNITIVIETTNVTRITFSNTTIVNEGPSYDELRSLSRRPIERYQLRREQNFEGPPRVRGNELEISVPVLIEVPNFVRPRRVKERVTEVNVENGWTSVSDPAAAERARTKIRTEATPPPNAPPKKFVPPTETAPAASPSSTPASTAPTTTVPPSPTPAHTATTTPVRPSPTPGHTATTTPVRPSPTPTHTATTPPGRPSQTPAHTATPTAAATAPSHASPSPVASPTPRTRPSPSARPRPSPSISSSPRLAPTASPQPSANEPAATVTPASAATATVRTRASPPIPMRMTPTPRPSASLPIPPRRTAPPLLKTPTPALTPSAATEASAKPLPTLTPAKRPPMPPRPLTTPTVAAQPNDNALPPTPREIPRRTVPPRSTPPPAATPAATPTIAPSSPAVTGDRAKNPRPPRPVPPAMESRTPTPTPPRPSQ